MIPASQAIKLAAFVFAIGLHAVLAVALDTTPPAEVQGGGGSAEVRLGTSFQDLVAGKLVAAKGSAVRSHQIPDVSQARPMTAQKITNAIAATPASMVQTPRNPAKKILTATSLKKALPMAAGQQVIASQVSPSKALPTAANLSTSLSSVPAVTPDMMRGIPLLASQRPEQINKAVDKVFAAPAASMRPTHRPEPVQKPAASKLPAQKPDAAGTANVTTSAGVATGRKTANAANRSGTGTAQTAGNAAKSNYPGKVMRCIARAARLNGSGGRKARISFRVNNRGRIHSVALSSSSGNARYDRAAIRAISRAGPCPPPPPGAKTLFSVRVE